MSSRCWILLLGLLLSYARVATLQHLSMEMDLTPKKAELMFKGDGGAYYIWSSFKMPVLAANNVGAGFLVLQPQGFVLPHYADSSKIGYVVQGSGGIVGMTLPNKKEEVVLKLKKGDVIAVPLGIISWWFNNGDTEFTIVFLGQTSQAYVPGQFTYALLTGTQGLIRGFSFELTTKAYNLTQDEAQKLTNSQLGSLIIKLQKAQAQTMPTPQKDKTNNMVYNIDGVRPGHVDPHRGMVTTLTESEFPFIGQTGLSVIKVRVEANAIMGPLYLMEPVGQLIYVARGSGKIEIVGLNGKLVLDSKVEVGQLFVVPKLYVVAVIAGEDGMEYYSILTSTQPMVEEFAGRSAIWKAISPAVQQVALNVDQDFFEVFLVKRSTTNTTNFYYVVLLFGFAIWKAFHAIVFFLCIKKIQLISFLSF